MESRFVWFGVVSRQTLVRWRKASGATREVCLNSDHFDRQESETPRIYSGLDRSHPCWTGREIADEAKKRGVVPSQPNAILAQKHGRENGLQINSSGKLRGNYLQAIDFLIADSS